MALKAYNDMVANNYPMAVTHGRCVTCLKRTGLLLLHIGIAVFLQGQTSLPDDTSAMKDAVSLNRRQVYQQIGFGMQPAGYVTSSISTVKGDDLHKNFILNPGNALYGRLAGLTVLQGGSEPGAAVPGLLVRGRNTFGGAGDGPLFVIDGFISNGSGTANGFMQLVPEEIATVSILKDASATAVYGSRGANGVILVTTKKGKEGPLTVSASTQQGFSHAQRLPRFLNAAQYAVLYNEARENDGLAPLYTAADIAAYRNGSDPLYHPDVNWYHEVLRPAAPVSRYNLHLSGGDNTIRYLVVLNASASQGLYQKFGDRNEESSNSKYARYNFRSNLDVHLSGRMAVEFRIGGAVDQSVNPYDYTTGSTFNLLASLPPNAFPVYNTNGSFAGSALYPNPVGNLLATGFYRTNSRTVLTSLTFTQQLDFLTKGLSAAAGISINNYFKSGAVKTRQYARYTPYKTATGKDSTILVAGTQQTSLTGMEQTLDQYRNIIIQSFLNYQRTFGRQELSGMLMFNRDEITLFGPSGDPVNPSANSTDPYRHNNGAGRLTYVYHTRYIAEFSGAYMGSNLFPHGKRYGFFPAASIGWVASSEKFLKDSKAVQLLKLRGSYGLVGNDIIVPPGLSSRYSLYTQTFSGGSYIFGTGNATSFGLTEGLLANPNLTWEKEASYNAGIDATLFNTVAVSVDYFNRYRSQILVSSASIIPQYLGAVTPFLNQGKCGNKGIEVAIRYTGSEQKKGFRYVMEGNVSYAKSHIVFNAEAVQLNTLLYARGTAIGQPFGYRAIGFFTPDEINQRQQDPKKFPAPLTEVIKAGDIRYQDVGGPEGRPDGIIDGNDRMPIGHPSTPAFTAGLHAGLAYKGFDLDAVWQGVTGNTVYLNGNYFYAFQNNGQAPEIALGRWTPQTAATAAYPRLSSKNNLSNYLSSSFWQRDAQFVKLRSAEIGYTLPDNLAGNIKIKTIRVFVNGTNLFSWDKIKYGDPESLTGYPVLRTVTGGISVNL